MPARNFIITGQVQGVFFRIETQKKAQELKLTGWVRNCEDGSVEVHAEGEYEQLNKLEEWLQHGPPTAKVENVKSEDVQIENCTSFEINH